MADLISKLCEKILNQRNGDSPLLVGLSGPPGSGKSTLSSIIRGRFLAWGFSCECISLDDFYYSKTEREKRAKQVSQLLMTRGVPGTHDMYLLAQVIECIVSDKAVSWQKFYKSADDIDLENVNSFTPVINRKPIILLEGWCIGCIPSDPAELIEPINTLELVHDSSQIWRTYVNNQIKSAYLPVWERIDYFIYIQIPEWSYIEKWRSDQAISNKETEIDLKIFLQFFERISRNMMAGNRWCTDAVIHMSPDDHSVAKIQFLDAQLN